MLGCHELITIRMELVRCPKFGVDSRCSVNASLCCTTVICPVMGWSQPTTHTRLRTHATAPLLGRQVQRHRSMHVNMMYSHLMDDRDVPLAAILREKDEWCFYMCDLGDGWEHRLLVEDVLPKTDARRSCLQELRLPPEDSNGLEENTSYADFLAQYRGNPASCKRLFEMWRRVPSTTVGRG